MTDLHHTEVPVTSISTAPEYKSVLPSVFFGFFAAPFQAHNAKKRGLKGNRYWAAAGIATFAGVALSILLVVVVGLFAASAVKNSNVQASNNANTSAPQSVSTPGTGGDVPAGYFDREHLNDTPKTIITNVNAYIYTVLCKKFSPTILDQKFSVNDGFLNADLHGFLSQGKTYCSTEVISNITTADGQEPNPATGVVSPSRNLTWDADITFSSEDRKAKAHWTMTLIWDKEIWQEISAKRVYQP